MDTEIIIIYCICDDYLKSIHHRENPQCLMSDGEVMTTALVAALYFGGNFAMARRVLDKPEYITSMLSKSRYSRRLHRIKHHYLAVFALLAEMWKALNDKQIYSLDTFPVPVCDNYRIPRAKIYQEKVFHGYTPSKRRYFYGLKIHLLVTEIGQPVEFFLTPGSFHDGGCLPLFDFDIPTGATVYADKSYNLYWMEDVLKEVGIDLLPIRKKNSKRKLPPWTIYLQNVYRKAVETAGSLINQRLPHHIHAVTAACFELKVTLFILALSFSHLFKVAT
jgi:hypothetical protein